jgi:RecB family exonuclease
MNRLLPWSFTKLSKFTQCPRAAYHAYVLKEKEPETPEMAEGKRVHKAFEDRVIGNRPLPPELAKYEPMVYAMKQKQEAGYDLQAEVKYGIDVFGQPTGFFDDHVWGRGAADVVLLAPDKRSGIIFDYKTGKRRDSDEQLSILALFVFSWIPQLEKITGANIWLRENKIGKAYEITREKLPEIKGNIERTLDAAETADAKGEWPEKPSHLCGWCPVLQCRFNKKGK